MNEQARVGDAWHQGDAYERYMGRWSERLAAPFLDWLAAEPDQRWLDVGCGTGALCAAIDRHARPAFLLGVDPSPGFLAAAAQRLPASVRLAPGSAESIPAGDRSVDIVVSGLVLNFLPAVGRGLAEMRRVVHPGGTVAAYVWDYDEGMQMLRLFWDTAARLDPAVGGLQERLRFSLCRPEALRAAFEAAGFTGVEIAPLEIRMQFADFDDFWSPLLGATGPAPAYVASLDEARRGQLRELLRESLPTRGAAGFALGARAWAVRGRA
ncbi:class I SAM-dependent methyltransferase [Ramlibacter rhizophilus]|uniref:Class I SAM-dependent methyltransferase n=1 Tax=Ramlibacter rhizophilus TaxID=1781167 RepID=A0A4Z0BLF6_9BURK|nr:class I SAM-dependent methyltransferase [Ramlibacter rhizophilus]TFY98748.1 class I SAM-dependent methyltransferase [Ramlibacter rhizophilus]